MAQQIDGPGGEELASDRPVLYKYPYCAAGRFRDRNEGWAAAVAHIRKHQTKERVRGNNNRDHSDGGFSNRGILFDETGR
jgi:hypothetical protein